MIQVPPSYLGGAQGIQNILNNYYEKQIASIANQNDRLAARKLIEEGLIVDGVRVSLADAIVKNNFGISESLLEKLLETRLIRGETTHLGPAYEVSHDTLVKPILKSYEKRRLEEERIEQQRLLTLERKKRQRVRLIAIGGVLLAVVSLIGVFVMWQQAERLEQQQQSLTISMAIAESSVSFSEDDYVEAFWQAYEAYQDYQALINEDNTGYDEKIIGEEYFDDIRTKLPYIYRNIWSSIYSTSTLYRWGDQLYTAPMPISVDHAFMGRTGSPFLTKVQDFQQLQIWNTRTQERFELEIADLDYWANSEKAYTLKTSENGQFLVYLDSTYQLHCLNQNNQKKYTFPVNFAQDTSRVNQDFVIANNGAYVVVYDRFSNGFEVFDHRGKLLIDYPNQEFLAAKDHKVYYQEADFNQIGVFDLQTEVKYNLPLPARASELYLMQDFWAIQFANGQLGKVSVKRNAKGQVVDYRLLPSPTAPQYIQVLNTLSPNTLIGAQEDNQGVPKVFAWDWLTGDKIELGMHYTTSLGTGNSIFFLDNNLLRIFEDKRLTSELLLPPTFDYNTMYSIDERYLCFPNMTQDKTLVLDLKMFPLVHQGPWKNRVIRTALSNNGKQLVILTPKQVYLYDLGQQKVIAQQAGTWSQKDLQKLMVYKSKIIVQDTRQVWIWDYQNQQTNRFEGSHFVANGYLCWINADSTQYKFINLQDKQDTWEFDAYKVNYCWVSPKMQNGLSWAILSYFVDTETPPDGIEAMDFNTAQREMFDISLTDEGHADPSVAFSPDGQLAALYDYRTENVVILHNNNQGIDVVAKFGAELGTCLRWLDNEHLFLANQQYIETVGVNRKKLDNRSQDDFDLFNNKFRSNRSELVQVSDKQGNRLNVHWQGQTADKYQDFLMINRYDGDQYASNSYGVATAFLYDPNKNQRILSFPDFISKTAAKTQTASLHLSDPYQQAWTTSTLLNEKDQLLEGYLLKYELTPEKLAQTIINSKKRIEKLFDHK